MSKTDKNEMFTLAQEMLACKSLAKSYSLFIHENYFLLCLQIIQQELSHKIEDPLQLLRILRANNYVHQHLLCELYMHDYILRND